MTYALDISQFMEGQSGPLTDDKIERCLARGIERFIVSTLDQDAARRQIDVLVRHPIEIQTYRAYEWGDLQGQQAADVAFIGDIRRNAYNLQKHWIDLESTDRRVVNQNIADCDWLISSFAGICPTGLYTSPGWWMEFMGNTGKFARMPWWVAHWNASDSLTDFAHFGGIERCEMHQTLANLTVEDIWCDTNYYEKAVEPVPPIPPAPQPPKSRLVDLLTEALEVAEGLK